MPLVSVQRVFVVLENILSLLCYIPHCGTVAINLDSARRETVTLYFEQNFPAMEATAKKFVYIKTYIFRQNYTEINEPLWFCRLKWCNIGITLFAKLGNIRVGRCDNNDISNVSFNLFILRYVVSLRQMKSVLASRFRIIYDKHDV